MKAMSEGAANGPTEGNGEAVKEGAEDQQGKELEALRLELEQTKSRNKDLLELAKRIQADFDNFKKRSQREREEMAKAANDRLVADLLLTLDDLERALAPAVQGEELKRGLAQVHANLIALLRSYGLREMPSQDRFDPSLHEALATCKGEDGRIFETYQKGYLIGNRVIRHAKVKVGRTIQEGEDNG